jgi:short-subunit dehydrogenase
MKDEEFREKYGPWALIAGASHGVGTEFARQVAARGVNCILLARRESALKEVQAELESAYGVQTHIIIQDLSVPDAAAGIAGQVGGRDIGLYIYNAGAPSAAKPYLRGSLDEWTGLLRQNCQTVMEFCYLFGPKLIERGRGGMLLVGSQAALGGNKQYAMYTATKGFMANFGESLWAEWSAAGVDVLNLLIQVVDSPTLRKQMKASGIANWDAEDIGVPKPADVAAIGLRELPHGPTFVHPQDEQAAPGETPLGQRRREELEERVRITAPFIGDD